MANETRFQIKLASAKLGDTDVELRKVQDYLTHFGYLTSTISPGRLDRTTSNALKFFQENFGLETTGELTHETIDTLELPRCGNPDTTVIAHSRGGETGEFVLRGCSYSQRHFTYRFVNGTTDIAGTNERTAVRNAFNTWASVLCGVTFEERNSGPTGFTIGWFTGNHGDGNPFDGPSNTLAHAFYPPPCGGANAGSCHL